MLGLSRARARVLGAEIQADAAEEPIQAYFKLDWARSFALILDAGHHLLGVYFRSPIALSERANPILPHPFATMRIGVRKEPLERDLHRRGECHDLARNLVLGQT
jgi:hypothetical protein